MELPMFKYSPNVYKLDIILKENIICACCGEKSEYRYDGPFYAEEEIENICPWCIQNGKASEKFDGEFHDPASVDDVQNELAIIEVSQRTPGFCAIQQENWLAHCNDLCAFIGYATPGLIKPIIDDLVDDIEDSVFEADEVTKALKNEELDGYVFQCLHCGKHRIYFDD